jgi:hypothetical protein
MHKNRSLLSSVLWLIIGMVSVHAQVVAPVEIKDAEMRALQLANMDDLKAAGAEISNTSFEYPFYLSRKLDLDQQRQKSADQRSLRFERYEGRVVLAITGNYYAAYSSEHMSKEQRTKATVQNVALPILKAVVPRFQSNHDVQGYALEISHHILGKVMGVSMERPENVLIVFPQSVAMRVLNAKDDEAEQAALAQGQFFINAEPVAPWHSNQLPQIASLSVPPDAPLPAERGSSSSADLRVTESGPNSYFWIPSSPRRLTPKAKEEVTPTQPPRDTSPEAIAKVDAGNKDVVAKLMKELDPQAHFVSYAEASFIVFRDALYLQLSLNTDLTDSAGGSRYRLAANAFDDHISHLVRPALGYFKDDVKPEIKFDGISFSTTVHIAEKKGSPAISEAVEFYFPFAALRCYQKYDCTGQQLLDSGTVLINGERVGLDLQVAEGIAH